MRRLIALSTILLLPLAAIAQPDGRFTLSLSDGIEIEGEARFGGVMAGMDVPQGANSALTFEGDDGSFGVLFSKDVVQPDIQARDYDHTIESGLDEDFHALTLFDYGFRLILADGTEYVSNGRPDAFQIGRDLTINHADEDELRGHFRSVVDPVEGGGARVATGTFEATPSGTPYPGVPVGRFVAVYTGDLERTVIGQAIWTNLPAPGQWPSYRPWLLTMQGENANDILLGQRTQGWPRNHNAVGYGDLTYRLGAGQNQQHSDVLFHLQLSESARGFFSARSPVPPGASAGLRPPRTPYALGHSAHSFKEKNRESDRVAEGRMDFTAWELGFCDMCIDDLEVKRQIRVTARYHAPSPEDMPVTTGPAGSGWAGVNLGEFHANVGGYNWSGPASVTESGSKFQFTMSGGQQGGAVGSINFGSTGAALRTGTFAFADPFAGAAPPGAVTGGFTVQRGASGTPFAFSSGSLVIERIADGEVKGSFNGTGTYRGPQGQMDVMAASGTFTAHRSAPGGQIDIQLPPGVELPPGVTLAPGVTRPPQDGGN